LRAPRHGNAGTGVAMLGTGWQRQHDERRSQRIVKIARDRHRARRQARRRPGAARPHSIGPEDAVRGAVVKNRLGDLLAYTSGNELLVVCVSQLI
ncbi:MAG: hypothetical protein M3441_23850, partial [Chloroflexota bacterium]|nr:hypothetical protein [Chloroflexota bacterium]